MLVASELLIGLTVLSASAQIIIPAERRIKITTPALRAGDTTCCEACLLKQPYNLSEETPAMLEYYNSFKKRMKGQQAIIRIAFKLLRESEQ
jgi:hypothetical protein